jgi:alpha-1,6-mannosyltransferase
VPGALRVGAAGRAACGLLGRGMDGEATFSCGARPHLLDATMFWSAAGGGGVRRYLLAKRAWLAREQGWQHSIVAPGVRGAGCVDCGGWRLPFSGGYRLPLDRGALARLIASREPELIEAADPYRPAWAVLDAAQRLGVPAVAFCHSNLMALAAQWAGGSGRAADAARHAAGRYLAHVYRGFDLVLAPSRSMQRALQALGLPQVQQQPLGVDTATFHPARRDPAWRRGLGLAQDDCVLLYAGRFAPEKHLGLLAAAVRRLGPRHRLVAIGHGPAPPRGAQVVVLPHEPRAERLARALASADAFVHAGDQETFGLAALEAMACGTPVLVRAAAGLAELVEGGAGIGVDSGKVDDWAGAIEALLAAPDAASRLRRARARAEAHDWQRVLPALLQRYQRLLLGHELHVGEISALAPLPRALP